MLRWSCLLLALSACRTAAPAGRAPGEVAAIVVRPSDESRAEIARVVSDAMGARVALSDWALTGSSVLVVERLLGPGDSRLEEFQLVESGAACVLIHEASGIRSPLHATRCAPELARR